MSEQTLRAVTVHAVFDDACDGVIRLVNDAQKFGFTIRTLTVDACSPESVAHLGLLVPQDTNLDSLASRFARHPVVQSAALIPDRADAGAVQALPSL